MNWNWYVSNDREIFVDLDSKRAMIRAFSVLRRTMNRKDKPLDIDSIWIYPSVQADHAHLIVCTKNILTAYERLSWALWLGSDRIRAIYALERLRRMCLNADVLASLSVFQFRSPDDTCQCPAKHKDKRITDHCPAMKRLLGPERSADYFPRNRDRVRRGKLHFPWGKVPKSIITEWK